MEFANKTVVLSGAASGMGLLLARCFVQRGGNAVMADIDEKTLNEKVAEVNAIRPGSAVGVVCDVRDYAQVCHVCAEAVRVFGSIDLVANFAGGAELRMLSDRYHGEDLPDIPIDIFDWSLDVNLRGQMYFDHAALKYMREQKSGIIVNIGSVTGEEGSASNIGYATAKSGAMYGLTKSIAEYGAPHGIRCFCVAPGPVMTREAMANMKTMLGRAAEPQEVVDFILYIASEKGAFFTGNCFLMDGGRTLMVNKVW